MNSIPQLNDIMPDFATMKPIKWGTVLSNLFIYLLKKMIDLSCYLVLIISIGYFLIQVATHAIE